MKKLILCFLLTTTLLLTTACGKETNEAKEDNKDSITPNEVLTLTCTKTEIENDGTKSIDTSIIKYNSNDKKILSVEYSTIIEVPMEYMTDLMVNMINNTGVMDTVNEVEGIIYSVTKESEKTIKISASIDYTKLSATSLLETFSGVSGFNSALLKLDITMDDIQDDAFKDYTCN